MAVLMVEEGFSAGFGLALGFAMANSMFYAFNPQVRAVKQVLLCLKCGGRNSVENKFCWHCGHPFYPSLSIKCPKCGSTVSKNVNFCENCGTRLREKKMKRDRERSSS